MSVVTIGDMLERAADFERRLESLYAGLRDRASRDGVRLLTYYLARHRRHLPDVLGAFPEQQLSRMKHVLLKHDDSEFSPQRCFEGEELPSDITGDELLGAAIRFVETLIGFYRWMVRQPLGDEAGELFQALLRVEERHVIELKKIRAMDYF
jgi:hypothetical protein